MKQIQLTITKEHDEGFAYTNSQYCPLANAVRPYFPEADVFVGITEIYDSESKQAVGKITFPGFTYRNYLDLVGRGKEFTTTLYIHQSWYDKVKEFFINLFGK